MSITNENIENIDTFSSGSTFLCAFAFIFLL
jgi:hypothetical protein